MSKHTLEISANPVHLAVRYDQLLLKRGGEIAGQVPCEEVGVLLVDHPHTTYTHAALTQLAQCGAVAVLCGPDHLPVALVMPLADHCQVVWRLADQLKAKAPLKKQL